MLKTLKNLETNPLSNPMTPSKEKEVMERFDERFDKDVYGDKINGILEYRGISDCGKCFTEEVDEHFLIPFYQYHLSELSRVEKETENRVWREAGEMVEKMRRQTILEGEVFDPLLADSACVAGYNTALSDISSTLLSQVKK